MNNIIILLPRAQQELKEAWNWYEEKQEGRGDKFELAVIDKIKQIDTHPENYSSKYRDIREVKNQNLSLFNCVSLFKIKKAFSYSVHFSYQPKP